MSFFLGRGSDLRRARWPRRRRKLRLQGNGRSLLGVHRMVNLERVFIDGMTSPELGRLEALHNMRHLRLSECTEVDPGPLQRLTQLHHLEVEVADEASARALVEVDLSALTALTELELDYFAYAELLPIELDPQWLRTLPPGVAVDFGLGYTIARDRIWELTDAVAHLGPVYISAAPDEVLREVLIALGDPEGELALLDGHLAEQVNEESVDEEPIRPEPPAPDDPHAVLFDAVHRPDLNRLAIEKPLLTSLEIVDCEGPIDVSPIESLTDLERLVVHVYDNVTMSRLTSLDLRRHERLKHVILHSHGDPGRVPEMRVDWLATRPLGAAVSLFGFTFADDDIHQLRKADKVVLALDVTAIDDAREERIWQRMPTTELDFRRPLGGPRIVPRSERDPDGPQRLAYTVDRRLGIWPDRHVDASAEIADRLAERDPDLAGRVSFRPDDLALRVDAENRADLEAVVAFIDALDPMPHLRVPLRQVAR